jgi:hypothetical protein
MGGVTSAGVDAATGDGPMSEAEWLAWRKT